MATNILALPRVQVEVETGTNEDWIDSIKYVVDDGSLDPPQLDLSGISFDMEVRRAPPEHEVILSASTDVGDLYIGTYPDSGYLIIRIDDTVMRTKRAGSYVGDIVARDENYTRTTVQFELTIFEGVTRWGVTR